jgi:hypothetical protein
MDAGTTRRARLRRPRDIRCSQAENALSANIGELPDSGSHWRPPENRVRMEQAGRKLVPCGGSPTRLVDFYWWPA